MKKSSQRRNDLSNAKLTSDLFPLLNKNLDIFISLVVFIYTVDKLMKCFDFFSHIPVEMQIKVGIFASSWFFAWVYSVFLIRQANRSRNISPLSKSSYGLHTLLSMAILIEKAIPTYFLIVTSISSLMLFFSDELSQLGLSFPALFGGTLSSLGKGATSLFTGIIIFIALRILFNLLIQILKTLEKKLNA